MLENFHLTAVLRRGAQSYLQQIPLKQDLQDELAESWEEQLMQFTTNVEEVNFDPGYRPGPHERFRLPDYVPPDWLVDETSQSVQSLDSLGRDPRQTDPIIAIMGMARDGHGDEVVLFQNFTPSRMIHPGRLLLQSNDTYVGYERPGLILDVKLSAVYQPTLRKLLFVSFRTANSFLPLIDLYREATEDDIREVLSHERLMPEEIDALIDNANQWFTKRIAMLRDSGILDQYSANQIKANAVGHNVSIEVRGDKIVFPREKNAAKRLLQFLVEELYKGPITDTLYETNSKRKAE